MKITNTLGALTLFSLPFFCGNTVLAESLPADGSSSEIWDKTFPQSKKVTHRKVTFKNRFGITLAADLYMPKEAAGKKLPAIAVSGPFGAVKEQSSGLYAQTLAERGFITLAFDPSFTGESSGEPRHVASPDINTEDFSAAVDFLSIHEQVDAERIGILGICGFGGFALNAAASDPRIKATVTSTMYDMCRVSAKGYNDSVNADARYENKRALSAQRTIDARNLSAARSVMNPKPADDAPQFLKDYFDYYKTARGSHSRSINSGLGWNLTSSISFINGTLLHYTPEIRSAVLMIHGEKAHSCYFSRDAFAAMMDKGNSIAAKANNKELLIIPGASHVDLYDRKDIIPFDKIQNFFLKNLKK